MSKSFSEDEMKLVMSAWKFPLEIWKVCGKDSKFLEADGSEGNLRDAFRTPPSEVKKITETLRQETPQKAGK